MYYYAVHRPYGRETPSNRDVVYAFESNDNRWEWVNDDTKRRAGLKAENDEVANAFAEGHIAVLGRIGPSNWRWLKDISEGEE